MNSQPLQIAKIEAIDRDIDDLEEEVETSDAKDDIDISEVGGTTDSTLEEVGTAFEFSKDTDEGTALVSYLFKYLIFTVIYLF